MTPPQITDIAYMPSSSMVATESYTFGSDCDQETIYYSIIAEDVSLSSQINYSSWMENNQAPVQQLEIFDNTIANIGLYSVSVTGASTLITESTQFFVRIIDPCLTA